MGGGPRPRESIYNGRGGGPGGGEAIAPSLLIILS